MAINALDFAFTFFKNNLPSTVTGGGLFSTLTDLESAITDRTDMNDDDKSALCTICIDAAENIPEQTYGRREAVVEAFGNSLKEQLSLYDNFNSPKPNA